MPVLRKGRMVRHGISKIKAAEPVASKVQMDCLTKPTLGPHDEAIPNQKHADQQRWINRWAARMAVKLCAIWTDTAQVKKSVNRTQHNFQLRAQCHAGPGPGDTRAPARLRNPMKHDRSLYSSSLQAGHGRPKRVMSVQQALEWAFRVERAPLELPEPADPERGQRFGFGLEYVLMKQAALSCKIDGG